MRLRLLQGVLRLQGDNWNDLLHSTMDGNCDIPDAGGCGGHVSVVFFYTFILFASLCLLNIFVAVPLHCTS
jgi:hypothetical protein